MTLQNVHMTWSRRTHPFDAQCKKCNDGKWHGNIKIHVHCLCLDCSSANRTNAKISSIYGWNERLCGARKVGCSGRQDYLVGGGGRRWRSVRGWSLAISLSRRECVGNDRQKCRWPKLLCVQIFGISEPHHESEVDPSSYDDGRIWICNHGILILWHGKFANDDGRLRIDEAKRSCIMWSDEAAAAMAPLWAVTYDDINNINLLLAQGDFECCTSRFIEKARRYSIGRLLHI